MHYWTIVTFGGHPNKFVVGNRFTSLLPTRKTKLTSEGTLSVSRKGVAVGTDPNGGYSVEQRPMALNSIADLQMLRGLLQRERH